MSDINELLGELLIIISSLLDVIDREYETTPEGKELVEKSLLALDKINEHMI